MKVRDLREIRFQATPRTGKVSALLLRPRQAQGLLVLAHGAGAGMHHPFMQALSESLAASGLATLRYQFPYMEEGGRRPNPQAILLATVRSAVRAARTVAEDLPLLAGGKSMGGRMTTLAAAEFPLEGVRKLVLFGFPLHPAGKPSTDRATHLDKVRVPMLFLQGTRDRLADLQLLEPICSSLGERVRLLVVDGADHSFRVPKSMGRSQQQIFQELAHNVAAWTSG